MFKHLLITLFVIGMIPILETESDAQTCTVSRPCCTLWKVIGGSNKCVRWRTGSEVCEVRITGLDTEEVGSCDTESGTCPVVTCQVFGTVDVSTSKGFCSKFLSDDCGVDGWAECNGRPRRITLTENNTDLPLIAEVDITGEDCNAKGVCEASTAVNIESCVNCCPVGQTALDFTARSFHGLVEFCPGGYDSNGDCCATSQRYTGGYSVNVCGEGNLHDDGTNVPGTPTRQVQTCTGGSPEPGENYSCRLTNLTPPPSTD
jgi:hypothetical protein